MATSGTTRRRRLLLVLRSASIVALFHPPLSSSAEAVVAFLIPGNHRPPFTLPSSLSLPRGHRPHLPRRWNAKVPEEEDADRFLTTASVLGISRGAEAASSASASTAGAGAGGTTVSGGDDVAAVSSSASDGGTADNPIDAGPDVGRHRPRRTGRLDDELGDLARGRRPDGARRAQDLLYERLLLLDNPDGEDRDETGDNEGRRRAPQTRHFNIVLNGWAERGGAERAEELLGEMERMAGGGYRTEKDEYGGIGNDVNDAPTVRIRPDVVSYTTVMKAWVRRGGRHSPERVQAILDRMEAGPGDAAAARGDDGDDGNTTTTIGNGTNAAFDAAVEVEPNGVSYATAVHAWVRAGEPRTAESVLDRWEERYRAKITEDGKDKPDDDTDQGGETSASGSLSGGGANRDNRAKDLKPTAIAYDSIVRAWCRRGGGGASVRARGAERVLGRMIDAGFVPRTITVNVAIDAIAKGRLRDGPERAEALLRKVPRRRRDVVGYTSVIDALARANARKMNAGGKRAAAAVQRARELLRELEDLYEASGDDRFKPRTVTFNAMLNVLSKTARRGDVDSAFEAEGILDRMEAASAPSPAPASNATAASTSSASVSANTPSPPSSSSLTPEDDDGDDEDDDVRPDLVTYTSVIDCWARVGGADSAERAEDILARLVDRSGANGPAGKGRPLRPDTVAFTSVIDCWAKSGRADAGNRAESVLRDMLHARVRPNTHTFTSLINAWGNSGDAARAERVLRRMERQGATPDAYAYTSVLNAWSKSPEDGAARRAEAIFERMVRLYEAGNVAVKPNVVSVTSVIEAWAKSREPDGAKRAEAILGRVERLYAAGNLDVKPDVRSFTSVISAWARSCDPGKAGRAQTILRCMNDEFRDGNREVRPNSFTYCAVLNACATTRGTTDQKRKALRVMRDTFDECRESGNANHFAYATFLRACEALICEGTERDDLVVGTFERCCRDGQVSDGVLVNLRSIVSRSIYRRLLEFSSFDDSKVTVNDLPIEWSCNTSKPQWKGKKYQKRTVDA